MQLVKPDQSRVWHIWKRDDVDKRGRPIVLVFCGRRLLIDGGVERFAECGPGKVLAGLNRRICRDCETAAWVDPPALRNSLDNWS